MYCWFLTYWPNNYWFGSALKERCASKTVPLLSFLRLFSHTDAWEVEPLKRAVFIVTSNHISIRHIIAETKSWFCTDNCTFVGSSYIKHAYAYILVDSLLQSANPSITPAISDLWSALSTSLVCIAKTI